MLVSLWKLFLKHNKLYLHIYTGIKNTWYQSFRITCTQNLIRLVESEFVFKCIYVHCSLSFFMKKWQIIISMHRHCTDRDIWKNSISSSSSAPIYGMLSLIIAIIDRGPVSQICHHYSIKVFYDVKRAEFVSIPASVLRLLWMLPSASLRGEMATLVITKLH